MAKSKATDIQNNGTGLHGQYKNWFLDYASYVILERAVPAVEDGQTRGRGSQGEMGGRGQECGQEGLQAAADAVRLRRARSAAVPSGPVTLSPDVIGLFHRQLTNLQNDIHEHLALLLELSRLARTAPEQLQARAPELAQLAPKISAEIQNFSTEFDTTFGISRGG